MTLSIRKTNPADYPAIVEVVNSQIEREAALFSMDEYWDNFPPATVFDLDNGAKFRTYFVALDEKKIVGFISYYIKENHVLWISELVVLPDYQLRGIGTSLLMQVETEGKTAGAKAIALETQDRYLWAREFFKVNGYQVLTAADLQKELYKDTLPKPPVTGSIVFGKKL